MSEEPDYSLEIDGHRYTLQGAMLVAERYENWLGYEPASRAMDRAGHQG